MFRIQRPKKHGMQITHAYAFKLKQDGTNIEENVDFEDDINIEEEGIPKKKGNGVAPKRTFKYRWKLIHKWSYPIIGSNGEERIKSSWYVKFKEETPYTREGSSTIKLGGLNFHDVYEAHKCSVQLLESVTTLDY